MKLTYKYLNSIDISAFRELMKLFSKEFEDVNTYQGAKPAEDYVKNFLRDKRHIVLVAKDKETVVGGLVAYELHKFEQERSEIFIYDLAVLQKYQRNGIATVLIQTLKGIAKERRISTIFVQADKIDKNAVAFYKSLKADLRDTYNFDIEL